MAKFMMYGTHQDIITVRKTNHLNFLIKSKFLMPYELSPIGIALMTMRPDNSYVNDKL
jgi:hypothetical protein